MSARVNTGEFVQPRLHRGNEPTCIKFCFGATFWLLLLALASYELEKIWNGKDDNNSEPSDDLHSFLPLAHNISANSTVEPSFNLRGSIPEAPFNPSQAILGNSTDILD